MARMSNVPVFLILILVGYGTVRRRDLTPRPNASPPPLPYLPTQPLFFFGYLISSYFWGGKSKQSLARREKKNFFLPPVFFFSIPQWSETAPWKENT
ncbi:hypothetical protein F4809DRAFT_607460 [Biscogniauxia mediterranea]|nr:hypothetical protein F4809DRAFT_607460 [Biscogniauxia mediterranea]